MNLVFKSIAVGLALLLVAACATSPKTQVVQMGDNELSRNQILAEIQKLDKSEKEIKDNKGLTGTNVASFLFWMPGLAYTYYDASEASKLIEQRRSHLTQIFNEKFGNTPPTASA